jgi:hypothetical protein
MTTPPEMFALVTVLIGALVALVAGGIMYRRPHLADHPPIDLVRCLACNRPRIPQVINPGTGLCIQCEAEIRALLASMPETQSTRNSHRNPGEPW